MLAFADRAQETTTTTGTGNITLGGAVTQFQTLNTGIGQNKFFEYAIVGESGSEWEVGVGYLSGSTTLVRSLPKDGSSGANTAVNFSSGTKRVFNTVGAFGHDARRGVVQAQIRGQDWF